jgi:hypothetical protein
MPSHNLPASTQRRLSQLHKCVSQARNIPGMYPEHVPRTCERHTHSADILVGTSSVSAVLDWQAAAREAALALPNRGPIELDESGRLKPHILRTLEEVGFYVFTGVITEEELADLHADLNRVLERSATHMSGAVTPDQAVEAKGLLKGADIDARLRAAPDEWFAMAPPLSDPDGGRGRSPARMVEGHAGPDAPALVMRSASRFHEYSEAGIRLYGHPQLLAAGASICGEDFAPDGGGESIQIKLPGLGPSVAWHQDGTTHWSDEGTTEDYCSHGFNFMLQ